MIDHQLHQNEVYNLYNLEANFRMYLSAVINLKAVTVKNYLSDVRYFIGWYTQQTDFTSFITSLENLNSDHVESYKSYLVSNKLPLKTINRRLSSVRMLGKYLVDQNILVTNPAQHVLNVGSTLKNKVQTDTSIALPEFAQYLSSKGFTGEQIVQAEIDINELFSIINLTKHV